MAARTYIPTFRVMLHAMSVYTSRWNQLMVPHLTPDQIEALEAFVACLNAIIVAIGAEPHPE